MAAAARVRLVLLAISWEAGAVRFDGDLPVETAEAATLFPEEVARGAGTLGRVLDARRGERAGRVVGGLLSFALEPFDGNCDGAMIRSLLCG